MFKWIDGECTETNAYNASSIYNLDFGTVGIGGSQEVLQFKVGNVSNYTLHDIKLEISGSDAFKLSIPFVVIDPVEELEIGGLDPGGVYIDPINCIFDPDVGETGVYNASIVAEFEYS